MRLRSILMASAVAGTALAAPAWGQETGQGTQLEEIIVTAQKREQSLKDVPISIASFDETKLAKLGVNKIEDLATNVPNLFINNFNGTADTVRLFIRGIGQNDVSVTQDPSVALYIDGVYVGSSFGAGFDAVDLERIEVLRGPQGTLYGRNATGGAINLITIKPDLEDVRAKVELTYGNYDYRNAKASLNLPIAKDVLGLRLSGLVSNRDGFYKNTGLGEDWAVQDRKAMRAALRLQPSSNLTFDYAFDYSQVKDTGNLSVPIAGAGEGARIPAGAPVTLPFGTAVPTILFDFSDPFPFSSKRPKSAESLKDYLPSKSDVWGHTFTAELEVSDSLTLRSVTGYRKVKSRSFTTSLPTQTASIGLVVTQSVSPLVPVGTVIPTGQGPWWVSATDSRTKYRNFSQEFQALGDVDFAGGNLNYVAGVYFYDDHGRQDAPGEAIGGPRDLAFAEVNNQSIAAFTELSYTPGGPDGRFHVTLGARYSSDKREGERVNENSFSFATLGGYTAENCARFASSFTVANPCTPTGVIQGATYKKKFQNFSPALTLGYDVTDDVRIYAKVATGYKSGGTAQRSANPTNFSNGFKPEKMLSYEAGLKGDFFDRRVRFNIAGFYFTVDDYQASVQTGATPGDRDFVGIDNSKIYGIESDLTVAVTDGLRLNGSLGLLKTKFGQTTLDVLRDTGQTVTERFIKPFSYAPKMSATISADYEKEIQTNLSIAAHVGFAYQSKMHTSSNFNDDRLLNPRRLVDASLSLISGDLANGGSLEVKLWGKNIFDQEYKTVAVGSFAGLGAQTVAEFGDPRTYGVTLIGKF